jgi:hypothetical protein
MSMGPLGGILGSAAGTPLSQTKGATAERAARDSAVKETADQLDLHAEKSAAGRGSGTRRRSRRRKSPPTSRLRMRKARGTWTYSRSAYE